MSSERSNNNNNINMDLSENNNEDKEDQNKEYCIVDCLCGRKYQEGHDMICCDSKDNIYILKFKI